MSTDPVTDPHAGHPHRYLGPGWGQECVPVTDSALTEIEQRSALERAVADILDVGAVLIMPIPVQPLILDRATAESIHQLATTPDAGGGYIYDHRFIAATDSGGKLREPMCRDCNGTRLAHMVQS